MRGRINSYDDTRYFYNGRLRYFGMNHNVGANPLRGYHSAGQFASNLRAPFQIPIISIATILNCAVKLVENILLLGVTFATFDFEDSANHGIEIVNNVTTAIYTAVQCVFQTLISVFELFTRSAATLIEGVAEVLSPCMGS